MKGKRFKGLMRLLLVALLLSAGWYVYHSVPIIAGYSAKVACSCMYNSGRSLVSIQNNELKGLPFSVATINVNKNDSTVTATVFGFAATKAIFRRGLGCTLVHGKSEGRVRRQQIALATPPNINPDTINWPKGNRNALLDTAAVNRPAMNKALQYAFQRKSNAYAFGTRALLVLWNGKIVAEQYAPGFTATTRMAGWSMTKSITNAMVGVLVKEGKLNVKETNLFARWQNDERKNISLDQLLHATSGLKWNEVYAAPSTATHMLFTSNAAADYALGMPQDDAPGQEFKYSSGTTNILQQFLRQRAGNDYHKLAYEKLFYKTGMLSAVLEPDASGTYVGSSFCFATARDWARFGLLYLNDGVANGERLLPEGWVKYSVIPSAAATMGQYGAQFWTNAGQPGNPQNRTYPSVPADCFFAEGYEGQQVWIIPSKQLVVVRLSLQQGSSFNENNFLEQVITALP